VIHGYEALKKSVQRINNESDEAHNEYLETHIKQNIEYYLDGKALTRFRSLLTR